MKKIIVFCSFICLIAGFFLYQANKNKAVASKSRPDEIGMCFGQMPTHSYLIYCDKNSCQNGVEIIYHTVLNEPPTVQELPPPLLDRFLQIIQKLEHQMSDGIYSLEIWGGCYEPEKSKETMDISRALELFETLDIVETEYGFPLTPYAAIYHQGGSTWRIPCIKHTSSTIAISRLYFNIKSPAEGLESFNDYITKLRSIY